MDHNDKLFNKIKEASHKQEVKDFAAMDKVWSRVEDKLDNKVLKKENNLWKKIAVAASFLLLFTVGYQFYKPKNEIVKPTKISVEETLVDVEKPKLPQQIEKTPEANPLIKKEAPAILKNQIESVAAVATTDDIAAPAVSSEISVANDAEQKDKDSKSYDYNDKTSGAFLRSKKSEAVSVKHRRQESEFVQKEKAAAAKQDPLVVVDGKPIIGKNQNTNTAEIEDIVVLKEPLYIINGQHYSEEELFGANPTSPYAPLNQQEIETISILQGEKATAAYGEKGRKGVVIIATKNGKPLRSGADSGK